MSFLARLFAKLADICLVYYEHRILPVKHRRMETPPLSISALMPVITFAALILTVSLQVLSACGHFPLRRETRAPVTLFASIGVAIVCLAAGIAAVTRLLPWYAAIIGAGLAVLAAPIVLQWFPDRFVDGNGALIAFAGAGVALALGLIWLAALA
jgi:hypothetical protein